MSTVEEHDAEQNAITRATSRKFKRLQDAAPDLAGALHYLIEQTIEQDLQFDIELTEGEKDAYRKARAALKSAGQARKVFKPL